MAYHEHLQDQAATSIELVVPLPQLHLQFRDLALDPLPDLSIRVTIQGKDKTYTTDADGQISGIPARAGARLRIAVQRFDGSYKKIEDAVMPSSDTTWNYISPQIVLEVETLPHAGGAGLIESSIPKAATADEGDRPSAKALAMKPALTAQPSTAMSPAAKPAAPKSPQTREHSAQPTQPPTISGGGVSPARQTPQTSGRTAQGHPMIVLTQRAKDWWNSWTLPTLNLWNQHGGAAAQAPKAESARAVAAPTDKGSKVPYDPSMLPKVKALIAFAEEQAEFEYGKGEGTAAVLAQMAKKQFKHERREKGLATPTGRCYQYVRVALTRACIVEGYVADKASVAIQESASLAGQPLLDKGFVDVTDEVPDARWAAAGDVIVYSWSTETWELRKKQKGLKTPNHGHIDIRSETSYISDFIPDKGHPKWFIGSGDKKHPTYFPNYVNVRIYRKYYDPRPTCRMYAFLACIREFECQGEHDDAKRYAMLNTALPEHNPKDKTFKGFDRHPWDAVAKDKWPVSTAAGAYQITCSTWLGYLSQQYFPDLDRKALFSPAAQDRLAVVILEYRTALQFVRLGDIGAAVNASIGEWTSLPGGAENKSRRTADGKIMDMAYFKNLFDKFLAIELAKFGIGVV